jgi:signal transduction histidine kinase/photosystem II stability/assembly factor-like uncharacterized protein
MKFNLVILFLIFINSAIGHTQSWQPVNSPTNQNLARLDMTERNNGWCVSYDGLIIKFDGQKWFISDSLQKIQKRFIPEGELIQNENIDWGDIYTIRMVNSNLGWIAVNNGYKRLYSMVYYDKNKWQPWSHLFPLKIRAIDFISESFGIAVGENGAIRYDKGKWKSLPLPRSFNFNAIKIISQDNFFIAGENGVILHGGKEWKVYESMIYPLIRDMDFVSDDEGWFVGNDGLILHYKNEKVVQELPETISDFWAIDMLDPKHGYIVGKQGKIIKYDGENWQSISSPTNANLHDIELIDRNTGWIVGAWGTILKLNEKPELVGQKAHQFLFIDQVHMGSDYLMDRIDDVKGVSIGDFNKDNLPDIYMTCYRSLNHLLINQGRGYYIDNVIESATGGNIETRIGKQKYEEGAFPADFDRDGDTDLFLAGKRGTTKLFLNNGAAIFEEVSSVFELFGELNIVAGAVGDFNEDGYPDIALSDETNGLQIFENQKYNDFEKRSLNELALPQTGIRTVTVCDFNQDNHSDIIVLSHNSKPILLTNNGNNQWQKEDNFILNYDTTDLVNSTTIGDFDGDGLNDLYIATENGKDAIYIFDINSKMLINQTNKWQLKQGGRSYTGIANDFDNDGDTDLYVSRFGKDYIYINEDKKNFLEVASKSLYSKSGYIDGFNIGAASADIDSDGDIDLIVGNRDHWSSLLQNTTNNSNYINIELKSNQDSKENFGAKVWLYSEKNELIGFRELNPSSGLLSYNWDKIHFGLGNHKNVTVQVRFLNGIEKTISGIKPSSTMQIDQSGYLLHKAYSVSRIFLQYLHIPQIPFEATKLVIFIIAIFLSVKLIERRYDWKHLHTAVYIVGATLVYSSLTFPFLDNTGIFIHLGPFLVFGTVILLLITINENIRKNNLKEKHIQNILQESGTQLSRNIDINTAISIAIKTIRFLYPYKYFAVYLYYPFGNYLSCFKSEKLKIKESDHIISVSRGSLDKMQRMKSPISLKNLKFLFPDYTLFNEDSIVFPMIRKQEFQGLLILGKTDSQTIIDDYTLNNLKYLVMQLAFALNNLQILEKMQDQQQLYAIGTYSSSILHNLKNPIDGLRMITEVLLNETSKDNENREYIEELYEGILKLKKDLLNSFDFEKDALNTSDEIEVDSMLQEIKRNLKKIGYPNILFKLQKNLGIIPGNSEQISQALENLIENAMEASNYNQPVQIFASKQENNICIEIKDYGDGIPVDKLDKLFNMFYSTKGEGRGLGLTITRNIIERHKGFLELKTSKKEGTVFSVILPINQY